MPLHRETPLLESVPLSAISGRRVFLKMENMQPAGSFKLRGIGHLCEEAAREGATQFFSPSGGNAGYAAAWAGRELGIRTTVIVPVTTSEEAKRAHRLTRRRGDRLRRKLEGVERTRPLHGRGG